MLILHGFPPNYRFPHAVALGMRYKMIGNSLSPLVAALILRSSSSNASRR
jgi:site-specific DNA-cytosine methylase